MLRIFFPYSRFIGRVRVCAYKIAALICYRKIIFRKYIPLQTNGFLCSCFYFYFHSCWLSEAFSWHFYFFIFFYLIGFWFPFRCVKLSFNNNSNREENGKKSDNVITFDSIFLTYIVALFRVKCRWFWLFNSSRVSFLEWNPKGQKRFKERKKKQTN